MSGVIRVTIAQATVADFRRIETRTGRPMVRFRVTVGKDRLAVIVFNEAAERLDLADGTIVDITGRLQGTSWTGADGSKKFGWQVVAEAVEHDSRRNSAPPPTPPAPTTTRPSSPTRQATGKRQVRMFNGAEPGPFDYDGGPF
jgi:single-stranded DNA-binding protein